MTVVMRSRNTLILVGLAGCLGFTVISVVSHPSRYSATEPPGCLVLSVAKEDALQESWEHGQSSGFTLFHPHMTFPIVRLKLSSQNAKASAVAMGKDKKASESRCHQFFTFPLVNPSIVQTLVTQGHWKLCEAHVWIALSVDFS